jgi:hypothetical protein
MRRGTGAWPLHASRERRSGAANSRSIPKQARKWRSVEAGRRPCPFCREAANAVCVADLDAATAREAVPTGSQRARSQKESENDPAMVSDLASVKLGARSIDNRLCAGRQRPRRRCGSRQRRAPHRTVKQELLHSVRWKFRTHRSTDRRTLPPARRRSPAPPAGTVAAASSSVSTRSPPRNSWSPNDAVFTADRTGAGNSWSDREPQSDVVSPDRRHLTHAVTTTRNQRNLCLRPSSASAVISGFPKMDPSQRGGENAIGRDGF